MAMMNYSLLLIAVFFSLLNVTHCQQKKPSFRILAPQVICKNNKDASIDTPSQITISMQTEGGEKLTYRVRMYFEVLGGYRGQQHALSLWRAVRTMEKKINVKDKDRIADKNQINVNNTELVQGVYYIFTITGIDESGHESEPQNFTVTYSDGKIQRTNADGSVIPDDITFLMLGSEIAYANLEYKIEANVKFCTPRFDYYFKWKMTDLPERYENIVQIPGNTLRVPAGIFQGGRTYTITAKLVQANDSRVLLSEAIDVNVKKRGFLAKLFPENIIIGISRPLELRLLYADLDNTGVKPNINWICKEMSDERECDNVEEFSEYQQSVEIYEKGMYTVNAIVQLDSRTESVVSNILVDPDVIVVPLFKSPPSQSIPAGEHFQMDTTLDGLIPNCFAQWTIVNETGFEYFDVELIPNGLGNISINDVEGNFLSELVDFVNSTVSGDISLNIPPKGDGWEGLKPNAKYKFRLVTTCPAPIFDSVNQTREQIRRNVTSYADLTIFTNQPPVGKTLEVTPSSGVGMKTIFTFSTGVAVDDSDDYPLKYNFQIEFDGIKISIGEFYENMITDSQLPFSETNVTTMYEVCDSREACAIVKGPVISTTMPLDKDIDLVDTIADIKSSMTRMEYDRAFGYALIVGTSLKNGELLPNFKDNFTKIVRSEINKMLENPTTAYHIQPQEVIKFVNYSRTLFQIVNEDDDINRGLLELLEMTETSIENSRQVRSEPVKSLRKKRAVKDTDSKTDRINLELQVLESLIQSKNVTESVAAMNRLVEKVKTFVTRLCNSSSFSYVTFNKSIINMEVREMSVNQVIRTNLSIPYEPHERRSYIQINENLKVNPRNKFCVGKIMFPSDYVSGQRNTNEIYDLIIAEKSKVEINIVDVSDGSGEQSILLSIPIEKESGNFQCQIWENKVWTSDLCTTSSINNGYVYCRCKKISIFRAAEKINIEMNSTIGDSTAVTVPSTVVQVGNETVPSPSVASTLLSLTTTLPPVTSTLPSLTSTLPPETSTLASVTSTLPSTGIAPTVDLLTATANGTMETILQTTRNETISTTSTMMSVLSYSEPSTAANVTSDIVNVITLTPQDTSPLVTTLSSATANLSTTTIAGQTTNLISTTPVLANDLNSTLANILSTVDNSISEPHKDTLTSNEKTSYSSATGYTLAVIFIIAGIFIVVGLFLYSRRKKPNTLVQQLEIISSEIRTSNNAVKYARFHDEQTMRGDNIETIFTAQ